MSFSSLLSGSSPRCHPRHACIPHRLIIIAGRKGDGKKRRKPKDESPPSPSSSSSPDAPPPSPPYSTLLSSSFQIAGSPRVTTQSLISVRHQIRYAKKQQELQRQSFRQQHQQNGPPVKSYRKEKQSPEDIKLQQEKEEEELSRFRLRQSKSFTLSSLHHTARRQYPPVLLVDVYNVLYSWAATKSFMMQGDLSTARDVLLRDLGEYAKHRGVLVVAAVDAIGGPAQGVVEEKLITGVIVAYCGDQEADSYIQSQVKVWLDRGHPQVIVATNDNLQRISIDGTVSHRQRVRESESESDGDEMGDDSSAHGEEEEIEKDYPINGNVVPQQRQQREEEEEENIEDRSSLIDDRLVWVVPVATLLREIQCAKESIQAVIAENNLKPAMLTLSRSSQLLQLRNAMVQSNKEEAAAAAAGSRSRNGKNSNIDEKKPDQKQQ